MPPRPPPPRPVVLLVDDEAAIREVLELGLKEHFDVETANSAEEAEMREERPRQAKPKTAKASPAEEPRRQGLDKLLSGEGASEEEYPELADELKGIGDIADLLREGGRERRRFGEELMRLFGSSEGDAEEGEEDEGEGARFN
mgnify:CR=1 FL=1